LLAGTDRIEFPEAYRQWIKKVYSVDVSDDEPDLVYADYLGWKDDQARREAEAKRLTTMTVSAFRDEDNIVTGLTRDGEMSLTVLPLLPDGRLLDGRALNTLNEWDLAETLNLNAVPVPASWEKRLKTCRVEQDGDLAGYLQLEMIADGQNGWTAIDGKFRYAEDFGLERSNDESA
jgi:CRISPR-associated endonuclease/helicase Cas3